jgi:lipid-A-disaccharide synthase
MIAPERHLPERPRDWTPDTLASEILRPGPLHFVDQSGHSFTITPSTLQQSMKELMGEAFQEMKRLFPTQLRSQALGGRRLQTAGAQLIADSSSWGAIGIAESLKVYPRARLGYARTKRAIATGEPGVFVPIDYGYLNIGLSRFAKEHGWKVVYFSPPGAWRKDKQGADLPEVTDAIITPFSWSAEILNKMGANAHWFGHPIKQMIREGTDGPRDQGEKRRTKGEGSDHNTATPQNRNTDSPQSTVHNPQSTSLAILPGSRQSEIDLLLPVFAKALKDFPEQAEIAIASSLDPQAVEAKWKTLAPSRKDICTPNDTYGVLRRARAAIVCSGTATLEAALCGCPHVVAYRVSKMVELQARLIRFKVRHIAMPNILLDRDVVPELVQHAATPEAIARHLGDLLDNEEARQKQLDAFQELDAILGANDAIDQSAKLIAGYLKEPEGP